MPQQAATALEFSNSSVVATFSQNHEFPRREAAVVRFVLRYLFRMLVLRHDYFRTAVYLLDTTGQLMLCQMDLT